MKEYALIGFEEVARRSDLSTALNTMAEDGWEIVIPIAYRGHTTAIIMGRDKVWQPPKPEGPR